MKKIRHILLTLALVPAMSIAQQSAIKVNVTGSKPGIMDFARAYCGQFESGSFERQALAAFVKGSMTRGDKHCVADPKNGYLRYDSSQDGVLETIEMCYWTCDNKNERLVAVNRINNAMGFDECTLNFYRYNVKTRKMKRISAPFDRIPQPVDMVNNENASKQLLDMVANSTNEDTNKYQPCYELPRTGKDIVFRMAMLDALPAEAQRMGVMRWNGSGFVME